MHWIQRDIFRKLTSNDGLRYSELKPDNVEGNLFMYHLSQLISAKYIYKKDKIYLLSDDGKIYVGSLSLTKGKKTALPTILVMIFCKNEDGQYLLYKWNRQPHRNLVSLPFCRVRFGQSIYEAVEEAIDYKTGLKTEAEYSGDIYIRRFEKDEVKSHYLAHIFTTKEFNGQIGTDGLTGQPFWGNASELKKSELMPGLTEIIDIVEKQKKPFFEEITVK